MIVDRLIKSYLRNLHADKGSEECGGMTGGIEGYLKIDYWLQT